MADSISTLVMNCRVLVCCGAGGVGKTTTAASLGLAAARAGRSVLVLTIDPSKRLAETMGVSPNEKEPHSPPPYFLAAAGIHPPGSLDVWMLDPRHISDTTVTRLVGEKRAQALTGNRIYQNVTQMIAGMQEYTAMEALYQFVSTERYDLVILDTPPSRNALNFLEGPSRLGRFFDGRIFQLFLPQKEGMLRQAAGKLISRVLASVFGEAFTSEFQEFLANFSDIFKTLTTNAEDMRALLSTDDVAFFLVTSPSPEALTEARYFQRQTHDMELPFRAFILNRSHALETRLRMPDVDLLGPNPSLEGQKGIEKLQALAEREKALAIEDRALLKELDQQSGTNAIAVALPLLPGGVDDVPGLLSVSRGLMTSQSDVAATD